MKTLTAFVFCIIAKVVFSQSVFLQPVGSSIDCFSINSAVSHDSEYAVMPSPTLTSGYHRLDFDLGRWYLPSEPLSIIVYGIIPPESHVYICTGIDDKGGNDQNHNWVVGSIDQSHSDSGPEGVYSSYVVKTKNVCPFAYRYVTLVRECQTDSKEVSVPQNGRDALIDCVELGKTKTVPSRTGLILGTASRCVYFERIGNVVLSGKGKKYVVMK